MNQMEMKFPDQPDMTRTALSESLALIIEHDTYIRLRQMERDEEIATMLKIFKEIPVQQRSDVIKSLNDAERTAFLQALGEFALTLNDSFWR